jgi:hypothetical protein
LPINNPKPCKRLGLEDFFTRHLVQQFVDVLWSRVVAVLAINRLCDPGSELVIERHWYPGTALDALLHIAAGKMKNARLYRCLDRLLPLKIKIDIWGSGLLRGESNACCDPSLGI